MCAFLAVDLLPMRDLCYALQCTATLVHLSVIMCFVVHACPLGCTNIEAVAPGGTDAHNGEDSMKTFHKIKGSKSHWRASVRRVKHVDLPKKLKSQNMSIAV
jgi:hypothetical protein